MALGNCTICINEKAKYKCPKCDVQYCSISCFKSPNHEHDESIKKEETKIVLDIPKDTKYSDIFNDAKFKYMLSFKTLQIHLRSIYDILSDDKLTKEKKLDQANEKLSSLRITGSQENEAVEEFCQYVTYLLATIKS